MSQAKTIAIPYENPFTAACQSARNLAALVVDLMYGTPERARVTMLFVLALAALGGAMNANASPLACNHDTLAATL